MLVAALFDTVTPLRVVGPLRKGRLHPATLPCVRVMLFRKAGPAEPDATSTTRPPDAASSVVGVLLGFWVLKVLFHPPSRVTLLWGWSVSIRAVCVLPERVVVPTQAPESLTVPPRTPSRSRPACTAAAFRDE